MCVLTDYHACGQHTSAKVPMTTFTFVFPDFHILICFWCIVLTFSFAFSFLFKNENKRKILMPQSLRAVTICHIIAALGVLSFYMCKTLEQQGGDLVPFIHISNELKVMCSVCLKIFLLLPEMNKREQRTSIKQRKYNTA